jgi:GH18 family chitinase
LFSVFLINLLLDTENGAVCTDCRHLDFMNILSYDYHSAFEPAVNHHAPLYPLEEASEYNFDAQLSIVSTHTERHSSGRGDMV